MNRIVAARAVVRTIPIFTGGLAADNPFAAADAAARSLNRARLVELPGVAGVADLLGRSASELLSAAAVTGLVRAAADRLALDPDAPALLRAFDGCFDDPATRPAALAVGGGVAVPLSTLELPESDSGEILGVARCSTNKKNNSKHRHDREHANTKRHV